VSPTHASEVSLKDILQSLYTNELFTSELACLPLNNSKLLIPISTKLTWSTQTSNAELLTVSEISTFKWVTEPVSLI
jgi:hypothetical protein